jgi:sarcosine oxidase
MVHYDIIILGVGGMGGAAAFELARRGRRVLGLEQYGLGHDRGSSHGQSRVIRKAYFEHPDYVPLLSRAYQRWYELEQLRGLHLFTECGCLSIGRPGGEMIPGVRRAAAEHRLSIEELSHDELRRRYPQFHFAEDYVGILERDAGFLYVEQCVHAHIDAARGAGADLRADEAVVGWEATGNGVTVRTSKNTYAADRLVITAGAWASRALAELGLPLQVLRKVLFWLGTANDRDFARDRFPVYLAEVPEGFFYGFPAIDADGHKLARHDGGEPVADPATVNRTVTAEDEKDCGAFVQKHIPQVNGPARRAKVCLYSMTPDQHFIIDVHPAHDNVVLAAGFSGHGFKFASAVGEILADLAEKGRTELPIGLFRLGRFAGQMRQA